jgi:NADPH-dependent 2,4-dienoyl-CoA reductase/sulfur reductase-like enzyme
MKHLILGNGPAGVIAAENLRQADAKAEIVLVGNEDAPPYSRMAIPYLLEGGIAEAGTYLRKTAGHFQHLRISEKRGQAVALDTTTRTARFADGSSETYDRLLIATGSHPLRPPIPGLDRPQVQTCWTLDDARAIAKLARPGARVVQLGAGFIGCIIMKALASLGVDLTVVEMGDRLVPRMMTPTAGNMIRRWVESQGVKVRTQVGVARVESGSDSAAPLLVKLSSGESLPCDLLIVAAGVAPNIDFLQGTAVQVGKGVRVDKHMQTTVPGIYAAGDVAEAPDFFSGAPFVSAIQPNAADQARVAALNMAGQNVVMPGALAINVLDTLGMISTSFGQWWGMAQPDGVEHIDESHQRYLSLQFDGEVLIGATAIGLIEHIGALRGLIQNRTPLGAWKEVLKVAPLRFAEAYVARSQQPTALLH